MVEVNLEEAINKAWGHPLECDKPHPSPTQPSLRE